MKTMKIIGFWGLLSAGVICAQQDPPVPVGVLEVNTAMVRDGVAPQLSWNIEYPSTVTDVVDIDVDDDQVTTKTRLRVQVCVIGVGLTDQTGREYPARSYIHFSSAGWQHIFTGKGSQVNPFTYYIDRVVNQGETLRFAAKVNDNGYNYFYNESSNIRVLKNGDYPPGLSAGYNSQTSIADYLAPYIQNGKLALGPMDLIYAAELTHTNPNHSGYDMQDTVVLVRFTRVE